MDTVFGNLKTELLVFFTGISLEAFLTLSALRNV
jgi:hypothetical protein